MLKDLANWGIWSGILSLLIWTPITCLLFVSLIGRVGVMREFVIRFVEPALKIIRACLVVAATALLSSAFFDWHILWFDLLAVALDACMVWLLFNTFNRVGRIVERELRLH